MGDETHQRAIPPFPWDSLRYILTMGGEYSPDTTAKQVPMAAHRHGDGIRGQVINRAAYGPVMECIGRAFGENAKRHRLFPAHWPVFLACEVGLVMRTVEGPIVSVDKDTGKVYRQVAERLCVYRPERPDAVVPDNEAAAMFGVSTETVREYLRVARRAVEDEWCSFYAGWDGRD
jgi:hypothetical protein